MSQQADPNHDDADGRLQQADRAAQRVRAPTQSERRHWQVIDLLAKGTPITAVAAATGYQIRTIRRIAQRFREAGAMGIVDRRQHSTGAVPLLSAEQQRDLREALRHPPPDV